jgi:hypothetical protein
MVESRFDAVALGWSTSVAALSFGGALLVQPYSVFTLLIEPDMHSSCIRLSEKTSRLHPRHVVPNPA